VIILSVYTFRVLTAYCIVSAIVVLTTAASFECKLDLTNWKYIGDKVKCSIENFSFNPPKKKDKIDSVEFTSNDYLSKQVEVIEMTNQNCPYIPRGWRKFFKHSITGLNISHSELSSVHAKDLKHFPKLIVLQLRGNFIQVLPHDLFAYTPHIKYLNVKDNRISFVEPNAFDFLKNLREIDFTNNICFNDEAYGLEPTFEITQTINVTCSRSGNPVMFSNIRRHHQMIFVFCLLFILAVLVTFLGFCLLSRCLKGKGKAV
jgi:Leucine rich repeat